MLSLSIPSPEFHQSKSVRNLATQIKGIADGDKAALTGLYDETCRLVFGLALRILGDRCAAEEVVIEVYKQVWRQAAIYDGQRSKPYTWLMTIARSRALDRLRSDKQDQPFDVAEDLITRIPDPDETAAIRKPRALVRAALDALPREQREVIEQAYFLGLSHSEIAVKLCRPLGTVKTQARIAMMSLREAFRNEAACLALI